MQPINTCEQGSNITQKSQSCQTAAQTMKEVLEHDNGTLIGDTRCLKLNLPFAFMSTLYITFPEYLKHDNGWFMGHNKSRAENIITEDGTHGPTTINELHGRH